MRARLRVCASVCVFLGWRRFAKEFTLNILALNARSGAGVVTVIVYVVLCAIQ